MVWGQMIKKGWRGGGGGGVLEVCRCSHLSSRRRDKVLISMTEGVTLKKKKKKKKGHGHTYNETASSAKPDGSFK